MATINLTKNLIAVIDDADLASVSNHKWTAVIGKGTAYARSFINGDTVQLHRFLLGKIPAGMVVDHINGDGLDNRRENLRVVTNSENLRNTYRHREGLIGTGAPARHVQGLNRKTTVKTFSFPPDVAKKLKATSVRIGVSESQIVRWALQFEGFEKWLSDLMTTNGQ